MAASNSNPPSPDSANSQLTGIAVNDPSATFAVLLVDGVKHHIARLHEWPEQLIDQRVVVSGRLKQVSQLPISTEGADGSWTAGEAEATSDAYVYNASWRKAPDEVQQWRPMRSASVEAANPPAQPRLSSETRQRASRQINEPDDTAPALAAFAARAAEVLSAEDARRFRWAYSAALRQAKWDADRALERVQALARFAAAHPELFSELRAAEFTGQAALGMCSHLPTRTTRGETVLLVHGERLGAFAKEYTMRDMLRYSVFYMTHLMHDEETQANGVIVVENLEDYPLFALNAMKGASPSGFRASFEWLGACPVRLRGIYACRQPWYIGLMLALVKPFMSKKLRDRVRLYGRDTAAMLADAGLTPEQIPPEYGGTLQGFDPSWYLASMRL